MTSHEKDVIKNLIKEGKIEQAFEEPCLKALDKTDKKDIELLEFRLSSANRKKSNGTFINEEYLVEKNRVVKSLLDFLDEIELEGSNPFLKLLKKYKLLIGLGIIILLSLSFSVFFVEESFIEKIKTIFNISEADEQLTVFVTDAKGNVVLKNEGKLNIPLGNRLLNEPIGNNGRTNFGDITASNIGDTITIGLKAEGWEIVGTNKFVFKGKPVKLIVKRDDSFGLIKGIVQSTNGESIEDAKIMINVDTTILTTQNGMFNVSLPEKWRAKNKTDLYTFRISKEGFVNLEEERSAGSSRNLVFVLEKEKPPKSIVIVKGCTDKTACNYNPKANKDDGSCKPIPTCNTDFCKGDKTKLSANKCECEFVKEQIMGCTDSIANNRTPNANCDDGSCKYKYFQVKLVYNSENKDRKIYIDGKHKGKLPDHSTSKLLKVKDKKGKPHKFEFINKTDTCDHIEVIEKDTTLIICT